MNKKCDNCGEPLDYRDGQYKGKLICTNYPECEYAEEPEEYEGKLTRKNAMGAMIGDILNN